MGGGSAGCSLYSGRVGRVCFCLTVVRERVKLGVTLPVCLQGQVPAFVVIQCEMACLVHGASTSLPVSVCHWKEASAASVYYLNKCLLSAGIRQN